MAEVVTDLSFRGKSDGTQDLENKQCKGKETENKRGRQEWRERKTRRKRRVRQRRKGRKQDAAVIPTASSERQRRKDISI